MTAWGHFRLVGTSGTTAHLAKLFEPARKRATRATSDAIVAISAKLRRNSLRLSVYIFHVPIVFFDSIVQKNNHYYDTYNCGYYQKHSRVVDVRAYGIPQQM